MSLIQKILTKTGVKTVADDIPAIRDQTVSLEEDVEIKG